MGLMGFIEKRNLEGIYMYPKVMEEICKSIGKSRSELREEGRWCFLLGDLDLLHYYSFNKQSMARSIKQFQTINHISTRNMKENNELLRE